MTAGSAWYDADRRSFLDTPLESVVAHMANSAVQQGWHIEPEQHQEWDASVGILKDGIRTDAPARVELIRDALQEAGLTSYSDVILEYDFRRRGLRIDCVLLAPGLIAILEFKRSRLTPADCDQVTNYCLSLLEFHEVTRSLCEKQGVIIAPVLIQTEGRFVAAASIPGVFHAQPWASVLRHPSRCDGPRLGETLATVLAHRRSQTRPSREQWLASRFSPSSTILDAAISLFGNHNVSAIHEHASSVEQIDATVLDVAKQIQKAQGANSNRVIFVTGSPGAGKTLVGLRLAFDARFRNDAVFVTGNAPLVDVLNEGLKRSYKGSSTKLATTLSGYPRESSAWVTENATFKIVKAHNFLGDRGRKTASSDGRVVIFDEAQRTYERGRRVLNKALQDHEADLILQSLEASYEDGAVVVALLGHKQAINRGERGGIAWLEAAERRGWAFAISDQSLEHTDLGDPARWRGHSLRIALESGHLSQSLRFYRNSGVEAWVSRVMSDDRAEAFKLGSRLAAEGHHAWVTRDLQLARAWARSRRVGEERAGLIASGQARRLAAEGLFVDQKPDIAQWMLAPRGDIRSSNMLETVQNQFQIQGLELDYSIVCWDADLRRSDGGWAAWKLNGGAWQRDSALDVAKNSYRVLLTRARKGMIVFVPKGDVSGEDETRNPQFYDEIAEYLFACGAVEWSPSAFGRDLETGE